MLDLEPIKARAERMGSRGSYRESIQAIMDDRDALIAEVEALWEALGDCAKLPCEYVRALSIHLRPTLCTCPPCHARALLGKE